MAGRSSTRGTQDLNSLRDLVGTSNPLPQTDLPSLRDLLRAGIYIKEINSTSPKQHSISDLSQELADLLISVYSKANIQFVPGQNMFPRKTIIAKIQRDWKAAIDVVNNKVKGAKQKKELIMDKLDKFYNVLYCLCTNIISCEERGCDSECIKEAHIECTCPKDQKIPVIELLFIRDQRNRNKKGLMIGSVDPVESDRLDQQFRRKAADEEIQRKKKEEIQEEKDAEQRAREEQASGFLDINDNVEVAEDDDLDLDFSANLKKKSSQNRIKLDNLARESIRGDISVRNTALLATALLVDLNIVTKEDAHLIVDPSKIQRARARVMKKEAAEAKKRIEESKLDCIFFDGRRDQTKMIVVDGDGDEFARTEFEEHYTITDPTRYLTHITPEEGTGAKGTADKVIEFLSEVKQLENVQVVGGDSTSSNTGWRDGAIHHIEDGKSEKVVWDICMLHTNELPLRHIMKDQGMETSGANTFTGELGQLVKDDVHDFEVNESFEKLDFAADLRDIPEEIIADLSGDQKYLYKIVKMIITGELDHDVLKHIIGPVNHSRWLTTGCRLCRCWVSKHGLRRNSKSYKSLKIIVSFIVSVYAPMWFEIKCKPNIFHGPDHMLTSVKLVHKYCSTKVKEVVYPVMQRGAWHAHTENMLLAMLGSQDSGRRQFAIDKIKQLRGEQELGNSAVRAFHVPKLNFEADSLYNLIDWTGNVDLMEPVLTCSVPTDQLDQYMEKPYPKLDIDCHTQSCERAVKVCCYYTSFQ
jgi:hypothetical protein